MSVRKLYAFPLGDVRHGRWVRASSRQGAASLYASISGIPVERVGVADVTPEQLDRVVACPSDMFSWSEKLRQFHAGNGQRLTARVARELLRSKGASVTNRYTWGYLATLSSETRHASDACA